MKRRRLAGLVAVSASLWIIGGASGGAAVAYADPIPAEAGPATCVVHSLPAFIAQGERTTTATVADVVEIECDPEIYGTKAKMRITDAQLYNRCEGNLTWYIPNSPTEGFVTRTGNGVTVELDPAGNATVALRAGPNCSPGETLVGVHMEGPPYESFTTSFTVLPPQESPQGVSAMPSNQVEDAYSSAFATIIQVEFPAVYGEQTLRIGSEELYRRCRRAPHLRWILIDGTEVTNVSEITGVSLDNAGNAFVIAIGDASCAVGASLIEADLETAPFTTLSTDFTILPPQPTAEPAFSIEKRQEIEGSGAGLTTAPLKASLGQTIDYMIFVKNTTRVPEKLSQFSDPHCDPGTLLGGPGSAALAPGETTSYVCSHVLTAAGIYTNEATATAITVGGNPLTRTSNQVVVEAFPPEFTIQKQQRIAGGGGSFTTGPLSATVGQTIEYQIIVTNTDSQPLALSGFTDERCDPGTLAGGPGVALLAPGASTMYTCTHLLTGSGTLLNVASVTSAVPGGTPSNRTSNAVTTQVAPAPPEPPPVMQFPKLEAKNEVEPCPITRLDIRGVSGPKRRTFTARVSARGYKQVSVYLDGRRLKTWRPPEARVATLALRINPKGLLHGGHRVLAKPVSRNKKCGAVARTSAFVFVRGGKPSSPPG